LNLRLATSYVCSVRRQVCPICKRVLGSADIDRRDAPFCSPRCRTVDLGHWLDGAYRIGATVDEALDEVPPRDRESDDPQ
jgi:uncharacterized protein